MELAHTRLTGFATHLPMLVACVAKTQGPVLELGCGAYSTPVLHALAQGRELVSYDINPDWHGAFRRFNRGTHKVELVTDWAKAPIERPWDVVLIDHAPGNRRAIELERLRPFARLVVVHDTEHRSYNLEPAFAKWRYRKEWRPYSPWTSVVSDVDDLDWLRDVSQD